MCEHEKCVSDAARLQDGKNSREASGEGNTSKNESPHISKLPRRIVPCSTEKDAVQRMIFAAIGAQQDILMKKEVDANGVALGGWEVAEMTTSHAGTTCS